MRESTYTQTASAADPCPTDEELAAYIDGGLGPAESRRVTEHLASCADCFELYSETARFLVNETALDAGKEVVRFPTLAKWRPVVQWLSLAALLLVGVGTVAYFQFLSSPPALVADEVAASLQGKPGLTQGFWRGPTSRGGGGEAPDKPYLDASFQMGVQFVNLQLSLGANDSKGARGDILPRIFGILETQPIGAAPQESYMALSAKFESKAPRELLGKAARVAHETGEYFDETYLNLGQWVEAGRLAALARDPSFFRQRKHRQFLRHLIWRDKLGRGETKLDRPTRETLEKVADVLAKGDLQASDYSKLESLLKHILEIHYPET